MKKQPFAKIRKEFLLTKEEIQAYELLPDNLPESKLTQKQKDFVSALYYKYLSGKVTKGWGTELSDVEKGEKWPSGPRLKQHEAQRMILGNLIWMNKDRATMTAEKAAQVFFNSLTCRESYTILIYKIYEVKQ